MNIFERVASRFSYTRKGRKIVTNIITVVFVSLALLIGSLISVLANSESLEKSYSTSSTDSLVEIPIVDSNNVKIMEAYPWPLDGKLTSGYGWRTLDGKRDFHGGIDISPYDNDSIIAIADGIIERIRIDKKSYGLYITIKHDDGFYTLSAHLAKSYVKEGDRVVQGQTIGLVGGGPEDPFPGRSTGRHLHFEVRKTVDNNSQLDPLQIFQ